jgi:hypothetical protein
MAKAKRNYISQAGALKQVADYIVNCENNEYDSYVTHCFENELAPADLRGRGQSDHVYALALIGLGLEFPIDGTVCPICAANDCTPIDTKAKTHGCDNCGHMFKETE